MKLVLRRTASLITSDKEQLRESIGISGERQSATELARRISPSGPDINRLRRAFEVIQEWPSLSRQIRQQQIEATHEGLVSQQTQRQIPALERIHQEVYSHELNISM